jgi:hypothetical protein
MAALLLCATARASAEFCPARVDQLHQFAAPNDAVRSFYISAESDRSVSGDITIEGKSGWYTVPFTNAKISPDVAHYKDAVLDFNRTLYHSKLLYLRLPPGETVVRFWVSDATTTGETTFGWDAQAHVTCLADAGAKGEGTPHTNFAPRVNDTQSLDQPPRDGDDIATAQRTDPPAGLTACATPFADARVKHALPPVWPEGIRISRIATSYVEVAVGSDGKVADAWIYQPSGLAELDFAALKAAKLSSYQAGVTLCQPAPGRYLFAASFNP